MILNSNQIQKIIPHRYPFLLVDQINELDVGHSATGIKCISANESFFAGHFPDEHVMPGVLLIEALAQVGAVVILSDQRFSNKKVYFAGIKKAKFRRKVVPGDVITLQTILKKVRGNMGMGNAVASVNGEVACECELFFAISE